MGFTEYDKECIQKAKELIDADIGRHYNIEFLAVKSGIGASKLKIGFKQFYHLGLYTYLRRQRMIKAAELLAQTDKTIGAISRIMGYKHTSNFIKAFASYHGLTPFRYRVYFSEDQIDL